MGIIIADSIMLDNGIQITNSYGTIGLDTIRVYKKTNDCYNISCKGLIWLRKGIRNDLDSVRNSNVNLSTPIDLPKPISEIELNFDINKSNLDENIYKIIYDNWKSRYSSVSDD